MLAHASLAMQAGAGGAGGSGPAGDPSGVFLYNYGGSLVGVQWSNGDSSASTQLGKSTTQGVPPVSVTTTRSPGATTYETEENGTLGEDGEWWWWCRHIKNGVTGDWVESSNAASGTEI